MDDDLYQNAWTETTHTIPAALKDDSVPTWTSTKLTTSSCGEEADLAAPSWSTGAGIHWNEPGSPGFTWSQPEPDLAWGTSVYEGISLGKTPSVAPAEDTVGAQSLVKSTLHVERSQEEDETPPSKQSPSPERPSSSLAQSPSSAVTPVPTEEDSGPITPPSPDGFGSFETGFQEETATESPGFSLNAADEDPWAASAWTDTAEKSEESLDEWERARQEKAKQDRRVPPELLANILSECEELCCDLFPEAPQKEASDADKNEWRDEWRGGLEGVPGLTKLMDSFLPPLSLKPSARFPRTLVAKKLANSVKLTKNLPLTRASPMSHYLAAKGSTAWEISVKEQKDMVEDDIPVGWRIVDKTSTTSSADAASQKKPTGRMFSFWGRRQSQITSQSPEVGSSGVRSPSLDKPRSPIVDEVKAESRRPSHDSVVSSTTGNVPQTSPSPMEMPSSEHVPAASSMSTYASAPDPPPERSGTPPAPSAMSRFLNRFSRRGSVISGSPRSSLALSSDDLEFLSDIVPSANDDADEDPTDALERFVAGAREASVSTLPPPLAPPPKPSLGKQATPVNNSLGPDVGRVGTPNDLGAMMDSWASLNSNTQPSGLAQLPAIGSRTAVPPLPPPLVPSRPVTPSATPGAGPSRPALTRAHTSQENSSSRPSSHLQTSTHSNPSFSLPPPPSFRGPSPFSMNSKPKLSSPFPLPIPPASEIAEHEPTSASTTSSRTSYETAAEASPTSPTSSLPLGALYPHLITPVSPPLTSAQPMLSSNGSSSPAGLSTPLASTFTSVKPSIRPPNVALLPPPQSSGSISPSSAAPLALNFFDDEDFTDFQSPSSLKPSPPIPSPIAKSPRTLLAAASSARSQTTVPSTSAFTFPPPSPSTSRSQAAPTAPITGFTSFDDDDFADFQGSPLSATSLKSEPLTSSSSSLFPSDVSDQALLTPKKRSGFDDMGDFFSSSLRTPSPPRVPAKVPSAKPLIAPPPPSGDLTTMPSASSNSSLLSRRKPHTAQHLHTLSLMEKAAARPGQWPAPPSPLPAAIPGPFSSSSKPSLISLMDEETPLPGDGLAPSFSSPAMLNPMRSLSGTGGTANVPPPASTSNSSLSGSLLQGWDFQSGRTSRVATPGAPKSNGAQAGGLSAQDLSFFEGL
ncbi:hypothetical protein BC628DRAFT_1422673 [Trametes gibbosa]|nr:hypothetical protein BC628DRAFT_1422673 [Trametes gibbosa]